MTDTHGAPAAEAHDAHPDQGDHGEHAEHIHMPPNSWSPISLSLAMTMTFVGFLSTPVVWIIGLLWTLASIAVWVRAARTEYLELPEHL